MKRIKKTVAVLLSLITIISAMSFSGVAASAATKGSTSQNTYCTVKISDKLIRKRGIQYATVKLSTGTAANILNTKRKIKITLRDGGGRYICSWIAKGGDKLKLGDDHSEYRIYFDYANQSWDTIGNTAKWKITSPKDCSIK